MHSSKNISSLSCSEAGIHVPVRLSFDVAWSEKISFVVTNWIVAEVVQLANPPNLHWRVSKDANCDRTSYSIKIPLCHPTSSLCSNHYSLVPSRPHLWWRASGTWLNLDFLSQSGSSKLIVESIYCTKSL